MKFLREVCVGIWIKAVTKFLLAG